MLEEKLVEEIVKALVDNPENVEIKSIKGEKSTIIEVKVLAGDIGKIIGKQGRIAGAIRVILNAYARKSGKKVTLEILDPEDAR